MTLKLNKFLPYRLSRLTEAMSLEIRSVYKDLFGLTRPEWRVLAALYELQSASAKTVGAHSGQHKTKVSRAVSSLERRRWLIRQEDPQDRRSEILALTPAGRASFDKLAVPLLKKESAILRSLSDSEKSDLFNAISLLEQLLAVHDDKI